MYVDMEHRCFSSFLYYSEVIFIRSEASWKIKIMPLIFSIFLTERSIRPTCIHNCPVGFVPRPIFSPDTLIIRNEKDMSPNRLCHGFGAAGGFILIFIHPSKPERDNYTNITKGHKVLGLIFVAQEMKVIRRGTEPVEVFTFLTREYANRSCVRC